MFSVPLPVDDGGDFGRFDLRLSSPEDAGVEEGDACFGQMGIDGSFMGKNDLFIGSMDDAHDVDISKVGTAFTPVTMGHAKVTTDFCAGILLHSFWNGPVKEAVVTGHFLARGGGLDVFEESRKTTDDLFSVEAVGNFVKVFE